MLEGLKVPKWKREREKKVFMCSVVVDEEEILMVGTIKVAAACWETPWILPLCDNRLLFLLHFLYIYFSFINPYSFTIKFLQINNNMLY